MYYKPKGPTHKPARIKTRYFIGQETFEMDEEERQGNFISRQNTDGNTIPLQEYLDFMRDLRDILNLHKEYFLTKMNVFYLGQNKSHEKTH
jgi:hypothetical protein